jgi:hypothetical protein
MNEPVAYINVEERELEWATPIKWETPTVVKMDKVPLYTAPPQQNEFNPDWDAMAVMVEEQQRMAKCIKELEAALAQPEPEPVQVSPQEFIAAVTGKENLVGIPVMMSVWPTKEKNNG